MSSPTNCGASQRAILLRSPRSVKDAPEVASSLASLRMDCMALLRLVVRLCSCSPAKGAEYLTTQRYSLPWTSIVSAAADTPGSWLLSGVSFWLERNSGGACVQGSAAIHPTPACSNSWVLAKAAEPLSSTRVAGSG